MNKALFEEENLYIVGESHLCEEDVCGHTENHRK